MNFSSGRKKNRTGVDLEKNLRLFRFPLLLDCSVALDILYAVLLPGTAWDPPFGMERDLCFCCLPNDPMRGSTHSFLYYSPVSPGPQSLLLKQQESEANVLWQAAEQLSHSAPLLSSWRFSGLNSQKKMCHLYIWFRQLP